MSLGLAALALSDRAEAGRGGISVPHRARRIGDRPPVPGAARVPLSGAAGARIDRSGAPSLAAIERAQTPLQRALGIGLPVPGTPNEQRG